MTTTRETRTEGSIHTYILRNEAYEITVDFHTKATRSNHRRTAVWTLRDLKEDKVVLVFNEITNVIQYRVPNIRDADADAIKTNTLEAMEGFLVNTCHFDANAVDSLISTVIQASFCKENLN